MRTLLRLILLGIICMENVWPVFALDTRTNLDTPAVKFAQANEFYATGDYQKAIEGYEELIKNVFKTSNVYYNLGNAYFKAGSKGKAILNYERALRYAPRDQDIRTNLAYVRSSIAEAQPSGSGNLLAKALTIFAGILSPNGWALLCLIVYLLLFAAILGAIFKNNWRGIALYSGSSLCCALLISLVCLASSINGSNTGRQGIVIAHETYVRYSPSYSGAMAFKLSEGIKVSILRHENDWFQVRVAKDKSGWVEKDAIEEI